MHSRIAIAPKARISLCLITAIAGATRFLSTAAQAQLTYITSFGSAGSGNGQLSDPAGVALGPDGTVYVTDTNNARAEGFTATGTFLDVFGASGPGALGNANGLAVSALGTVYVPTSGSNVQTFNATGAYLGGFGTFGTGNGQFENATAATFGPNGVLYVTDANNNRVEAFTSTGAFLFAFGSGGSGAGQLNFPFGIAASPAGNIYVADNDNSRINVYSATGVYQSLLASTGSGNGQVSKPGGLAVSATGTVYVADYGNNRIDTFNSAGTFLASFGTGGSGSGQFFGPSGVAVAPNGTVYVVNTGNNRIDLLFDPSTWVAGSQSFTNIFQGPINVGVGPSAVNDILGTSLTLNPAMSLTAFGLSIDVGGTLTEAGGTLAVTSSPPGMGVAGNFIYQSGAFSASALNVVTGGTFRATQGGALIIYTSVTVGGQMSLDGGVTLTGPTATIFSGGLIIVGNSTVNLTGVLTNSAGGELQLVSPTATNIQASSIQNSGLIDGSGRLIATVANLSGGQLSVGLNQTMTITGAGNTNASGGLINLAGGTLHFTQGLTNQSGGIIAGFGDLRVDGGLLNNGLLALAGSTGIFPAITNSATGTIHLSGSQPNVFFNAIANAGLLTVDAGATGTLYGAYTGAGPITNNGSLYINASSIAGAITGNGNLTLGAGPSPASLVLTTGSGISTLATLTLDTTSQLDLTNNSMVVHNGANVPALIKQAANLGAWNGVGGITSSSAHATATTSTVTALAYATGAEFTTATGQTTFGGQSFARTDLLVKYTLAGDANLDGSVTFADFLALQNNYNQPGDWSQGDWNYDGQVTFADFLILQNNYNKTLATSPILPANEPSPAPEPASLVALLLGATALITRNGRRRSRFRAS